MNKEITYVLRKPEWLYWITIGNGDGQFDGGELEKLNTQLQDKNIKLSLGLDYQKVAAQAQDKAHYVNVNKVYSVLETELSGENNLDIVDLDVIWISHFAHNDWIVPLDSPQIRSNNRYKFGVEHEAGKVLVKHADGSKKVSTFAKPNFLNVGFLMYRTDLMKQIGARIPKTWDELLEILRQAKDKNFDGFVFQGGKYEGLLVNFIEILWAKGGDIDENGMPIVHTPESVSALQLMKLLFKEGLSPREVLSYDEVKILNHFSEKDTLVLRNWPRAYYSMQHHKKYKAVRNKVDVFPKPLPFDGVPRGFAKMCLGGWFYAVSRSSLLNGRYNKAVTVINHLTSDEQYYRSLFPSQYSKEKGEYAMRIPADKIMIQYAKGRHDALDHVYEYLENRYYRTRPEIPNYYKFSKILVKYLHRALEDDLYKAKDALEDAQAEIEDVFSSKRRISGHSPTCNSIREWKNQP